MKKIIISFVCLFVFAVSAFAHPYEMVNFFMNKAVTGDAQAKSLLSEFAKDVGQAISGGAYGVGGNLDTFGFTLSIKMSYQQLLTNDLIATRLGDSAINYPIIQGEFLLSENLTGIGRISYSNDSYVIGAGARYLAYEGYDYIPTISVQSVFNYMIANVPVQDARAYVPNQGRVEFHSWNLKTAPTFYFQDVPYVQPYFFVSFDVTELNLLSSDRSGLSTYAYGVGYGLGAQAKIEPLNLSFTLSVYESRLNYNFGVFVGF
ncbi:hypothetical protein [Endomicrobium proavitum]|uniref:Outer membrane protein beta-barrel domain-containing protein n=1 Tax=Endomicrobium proavitum TaxID=1408281 RepID=A0A0G3WI45_9BACT|nr:hypothetical protein [Endomicrobium proavitum]AKL97537.1 exported protein of unknown function [Endomicrobium proavitum]